MLKTVKWIGIISLIGMVVLSNVGCGNKNVNGIVYRYENTYSLNNLGVVNYKYKKDDKKHKNPLKYKPENDYFTYDFSIKDKDFTLFFDKTNINSDSLKLNDVNGSNDNNNSNNGGTNKENLITGEFNNINGSDIGGGKTSFNISLLYNGNKNYLFADIKSNDTFQTIDGSPVIFSQFGKVNIYGKIYFKKYNNNDNNSNINSNNDENGNSTVNYTMIGDFIIPIYNYNIDSSKEKNENMVTMVDYLHITTTTPLSNDSNIVDIYQNNSKDLMEESAKLIIGIADSNLSVKNPLN